MVFFTPQGRAIHLNQFASVYQTTGPTKLTRKNRNPTIYVYSQVNRIFFRYNRRSIQEALKKANLPIPEIIIGYDGDLRNQAEDFQV